MSEIGDSVTLEGGVTGTVIWTGGRNSPSLLQPSLTARHSSMHHGVRRTPAKSVSEKRKMLPKAISEMGLA